MKSLRECSQLLSQRVFDAFLTLNVFSNATRAQIEEAELLGLTQQARWHLHVVKVFPAQAGGRRPAVFIRWGFCLREPPKGKRHDLIIHHQCSLMLCSQQEGCAIGWVAALFPLHFSIMATKGNNRCRDNDVIKSVNTR